MPPINLNSFIGVLLPTMAAYQTAVADGDVTVEEAIDIMATAAKATAHQMGIADKVVATTQPEKHETSA